VSDAPPVFVVVDVVNVVFHLPGPSPVINLREADGLRHVYFPIGLQEAQSVAYVLERETPPRPTAHDLLNDVLDAAGVDVVAVRITAERGGTMLAELDLMAPKGHIVLDCRPSDGIAIALRRTVKAPILCEESLFDR
jgi:bifunctional DNase/RNase